MVEPFVCDPVCNRDPVSNRAKNGKKEPALELAECGRFAFSSSR